MGNTCTNWSTRFHYYKMSHFNFPNLCMYTEHGQNCLYAEQRCECSCVEMLVGLHVNSFIPLACAECDDSLPFSGASSVPLLYVHFPATLLHQLFFHPLSPHLAIYFLVYLSILLFPNSYIIPFLEFCSLPLSVHAQTNVT